MQHQMSTAPVAALSAAALSALDGLITHVETAASLSADDIAALSSMEQQIHQRAVALRLAARRKVSLSESPFRILDEAYLDTEQRAIRLVTAVIDRDSAFPLALCCSQLRDAVFETADARHAEAVAKVLKSEKRSKIGDTTVIQRGDMPKREPRMRTSKKSAVTSIERLKWAVSCGMPTEGMNNPCIHAAVAGNHRVLRYCAEHIQKPTVAALAAVYRHFPKNPTFLESREFSIAQMKQEDILMHSDMAAELAKLALEEGDDSE